MPARRAHRSLSCLLALAAMALPLRHTLAQSCTVTGEPVNFGPYNPISASPLTATGRVTVSCQAPVLGLLVPFNVALSQGTSGSFNRSMSGTSTRLHYQLYTNATYSTPWGDGTSGTSTVAGSVLVSLLNLPGTAALPVYGRVPGGQNVRVGVYTDIITIIVNY